MASKHYMWQKRWVLDRDNHCAYHDSGLIVDYVNGRPVARNESEIIEALSVKNGHNAVAMTRRLISNEAVKLWGAVNGE